MNLKLKHYSLMLSITGIAILYFISLLSQPVLIELSELPDYEEVDWGYSVYDPPRVYIPDPPIVVPIEPPIVGLNPDQSEVIPIEIIPIISPPGSEIVPLPPIIIDPIQDTSSE